MIPLQHEHFFFSKDCVIQAGAGTGKTHTLVTQYLHLCSGLSAHKRPLLPAEILVLTFTEKAAFELHDRLRTRLKRLFHTSLDLNYEEQLEQIEPELYATAKAHSLPLPSNKVWGNVLSQLEFFPPSTFHGYSANLLRRYARHLALDPEFQLLSESEAFTLQTKQVRSILLSLLEQDLTSANSYQEQSPFKITKQDAEHLILQYGLESLSEQGALPELVAKVIQKSREEGLPLQEISDAYLPRHCSSAWREIYKQAAQAISSFFALPSHLGKTSSLLVEGWTETYASLWQFFSAALDSIHSRPESHEQFPTWAHFLSVGLLPTLKAFCAELGQLRAKQEESSRALLASVKSQFQQVLEETEALLITDQAAPLAQALEKLCEAASEAYTQAKAYIHSLDFIDLLQKTCTLLQDHPYLRKQIQAGTHVILVDEFQDTNPLQAKILSLLTWDVLPTNSPQTLAGRITIVGDRKQSIYQFRGANVSMFQSFCQEILSRGGIEVTLTTSRRSLPNLIHFSNALFAKIFREEEWNHDRDALLLFREENTPPNSKGPLSPELLSIESAPEELSPIETEALGVAKRIQLLLAEGHAAHEIAILLRRFTHVDIYTEALSQAGIQTQVVNGRGFYQSSEIWDLSSALLFIADPTNKLALLSLLRSPLWGMRDSTIYSLHRQDRLSIAGLLSLSENDLPDPTIDGELTHLLDMANLLSDLVSLGELLGPSTCLKRLYERSGYREILRGLPRSKQRLANVEQLIQTAQDFEYQGGLLTEFAHELDKKIQDPALKSDPPAPILGENQNAVHLMTIHQAKGLDFPVVVIAGCSGTDPVDAPAISYHANFGIGLTLRAEGDRAPTLPYRRISRLLKQEQQAESLRLFYVAVTRAKDKVIFSGEGRTRAKTWRSYLEDFLLSSEGHLLKKYPLLLSSDIPLETRERRAS